MNEHNTQIWELMLSGEPYDAADPYLIAKLEICHDLVAYYNTIRPSNHKGRTKAVKQILGRCGERVNIIPPFHCDYGCNIRVGEDFFANFNFTVLDEGLVTIGSHAYIGPNVSIYTPCHPLDAENRNRDIQWTREVKIGDNVWIGGNAIILPGVTIGNNCVIGAGAVVARDIPDNSLAVGNPCRVIKPIPQ